MIDNIYPHLYRIEIPLPGNPLKAVNSYVFKTPERNLIIDTGMNRRECLEAMMAGLNELDIDLNNTDLFITHMHSDHSGLISKLASPSSTVYCSKLDGDIINSTGDWREGFIYAQRNGFPSDEDAIRLHPGFKYGNHEQVHFTTVSEGYHVTIADYDLECIWTPGHTPGHMCLYDAKKKLLLSGDHILGRITPNISSWSEDENPLDQFLKSLDKIYDLEVEVVLPAHRKPISDCRLRIDQLRQHHANRAESVVSILKSGPQNAYQVAGQMKWDLSYTQWDQFPVTQKWFATGEVVAHLKYLEMLGRVRKEHDDEEITYVLT